MDFFDKRLASLSPYVPGEQPKDIANLIKLNTNENPFPPSPKAVEAGAEAVKRVHLYSDPTSAETDKGDSLLRGRFK